MSRELNPRCKENLNSSTSSLERFDNIFNLYCYVSSYSFISLVSELVLSSIDPDSETWASDSFTLHPGEELVEYFEASFLSHYAFG